MSSVEDWNIDALAAEAPQLHGPFMYKDEPLSVEIREDFPHLRPMEYDALKSIYSNPTYGEPVVAYLLQQEEDVQRHILLNYVYVQTQEQRQRMQEERQSAQNSLGELTLRLNQVEAALASKPKGRNDSSDVLKLRVLPYSGRERESLRRWFVELETAMVARKIYAEDRKVAFALSSLAGPARAWGYNLLLADKDIFPSYEAFKEKLSEEFEPPRTLQRAISELLDLTQGKRTLHEYIQHMRYLISCASTDPPSESFKVTHFMRGLKPGYVRDEVYRLSPETFDAAVHFALDAEFNHRQQRADQGSRGSNRPPHYRDNNGPTPMDISSIQVNRLRFQNNRGSRPQGQSRPQQSRPRQFNPRDKSNSTCHRCGQKGHWAPDCSQPRRNNTSDARPHVNRGRVENNSKNGAIH